MKHQDTIVALATPAGQGAIGIIRLSGANAISITQKLFKGKNLEKMRSHGIAYGHLTDKNEKVIDEVVISLFKAPNSYTKEDVVEISCHGSNYILQKVIHECIELGARTAEAGEFTQRAFLNGRFDLAQAEAVADLIAAESEAMQQTALNQMRGGFSEEIKILRDQLIHFASMIELELDFSEEDVEFANRDELRKLIHVTQQTLNPLIESFRWGNVIKNGVPVVIAGKPNAGKSTLLNALLNEQRAIVSEIAGTTRDVIEDELTIDGIRFRFIDTAGLRETNDQIEAIGVEKTQQKMKEASVILYLVDLQNTLPTKVLDEINDLKLDNTTFILVGNKQETLTKEELADWKNTHDVMTISAKTGDGLADLKNKLVDITKANPTSPNQTIVTNSRHYHHLKQTEDALNKTLTALDSGISGDLLALDIREALHHLGAITGRIDVDKDILGTIFGKFCIGK